VFLKEQKLAQQLRELYKEYEVKTSLALIPFYMDRIEFIRNQIRIKKPMMNQGDITEKEIDFLEKQKQETIKLKLDEIKQIDELAQKLYSVWKDIKAVREENDFHISNVKLQVHNDKKGAFMTFNLLPI
jgi:hypothetical protein